MCHLPNEYAPSVEYAKNIPMNPASTPPNETDLFMKSASDNFSTRIKHNKPQINQGLKSKMCKMLTNFDSRLVQCCSTRRELDKRELCIMGYLMYDHVILLPDSQFHQSTRNTDTKAQSLQTKPQSNTEVQLSEKTVGCFYPAAMFL